jgi:hypothetical protein
MRDLSSAARTLETAKMLVAELGYHRRAQEVYDIHAAIGE